MPDISLLQREYEVVEEEGRAPSWVLTAAVTIILIVVGAWLSLYFFSRFYLQTADEIGRKVEDLKLKEAGEAIERLKVFGNKAAILSSLRQAHTSAAAAFQKVEESTHPLARFESGDFKIIEGSVELKGSAPTALILSRQVGIYMEDKDIAEFSISGIAYGKEHGIAFNAALKFR